MFKIDIVLVIIVSFVLSQSCSNKKVDKTPIEVLPYAAMLQAELQQIDSTPLAIFTHHIDTNGTIVDTTIITKEAFKQQIKPFIEADISVDKLKKYYDESMYFDATTNTNAFAYTTKDEAQPVKQVIITTSTGVTSKLSTVLLTKNYSIKDTIVNENLFWKANQYCTIAILKKVNGQLYTDNKKIVWGLQPTTSEINELDQKPKQ